MTKHDLKNNNVKKYFSTLFAYFCHHEVRLLLQISRNFADAKCHLIKTQSYDETLTGTTNLLIRTNHSKHSVGKLANMGCTY